MLKWETPCEKLAEEMTRLEQRFPTFEIIYWIMSMWFPILCQLWAQSVMKERERENNRNVFLRYEHFICQAGNEWGWTRSGTMKTVHRNSGLALTGSAVLNEQPWIYTNTHTQITHMTGRHISFFLLCCQWRVSKSFEAKRKNCHSN